MYTVIKVENLSKQYRLGSIGTGSLAHDINRAWYRLRGREDPYLKIGDRNEEKNSREYIWALRNISFEVRHGEVLGIIGRNGAGKSTLLKILSRTTIPTIGKVKIKGRVASLLEVGTGFHPELTGRENIFLNGAILGMTKKEIKSRLEEIVDFAGVEQFIDTPVKRYSSGMYVRLAFGVAAHLEPEILIVDEVLAVGDFEFQKKALGKMKEVSNQEGRTVLFVSHNMAAIQALCTHCIYLKDGLLIDGPDETELVISGYLKSLQTGFFTIPVKDRRDREGAGEIQISDIKILDKNQQEIINLISGQETTFFIEYASKRNNYDNAPLEIAISLSRNDERLITVVSTKYVNAVIRNTPERSSVRFLINKLPLMTGTYLINVMIRKNGIIQDWLREAKIFDVENGDYYKTGANIPESHTGVYIDYTVQ